MAKLQHYTQKQGINLASGTISVFLINNRSFLSESIENITITLKKCKNKSYTSLEQSNTRSGNDYQPKFQD